MNSRFVQYFMDVAKLTANLSYAEKLKVGCVIVKDKRIISFGYNGTPSGWSNVCEDVVYDSDGNRTLVTKSETIHAEENSIMKLVRDGESGKDSSIFITHAPCINCSRLIYNAGIIKVFYNEQYRSSAGIEFLEKCKISVEKV